MADRIPRKLRITDNPSNIQKQILRFQYGGRRYTRQQYIDLRVRYNEELPLTRQRFRLRQLNINRRQDRAVRVIQGARNRRDRVGAREFIPQGDNVFQYKEWLRNFRGQTVKVFTIQNGIVIDEKLVEVPQNAFNAWWNNIGSYSFLIGPSGEQTTPLSEGGDLKVVITTAVRLESNRIQQLFREGVNHCMFQPMLSWAQGNFLNVESRTSKFRYQRIIKQIKEYIEEYDDGVPEDKIQDVCNTLQVNIVIDLPFGKEENFLTFKSLKSPLTTFRFVNTKLNHIDINNVISKEYIETESEEFDQIVKGLEESGEYFDYVKNKENEYIKIRTLTGNYGRKCEFMELCNEFEKESGIVNCKLDGVKNWEVWNFCNEGNKTCGTQLFQSQSDSDLHIDMEYAYANFHKCKEYEGFLGKITDFRMCDKKDFTKVVGYYKISKITFTESFTEKTKQIFDNLNYIKEYEIYPSVELKKWESLGLDIEVSEGCWGTPLDFRFSEELLKKVDGEDSNPRGYSKWCGIGEKCNDRQSFQMKGDKEFFQNIISYLDTDSQTEISYFQNDREGTISYPKQNCFGTVHIVGFIKMYQRLSMINQMLLLEPDNIVGVQVDGIFYKPHKFELIQPFREKESKGKLGHTSYNFTNKISEDESDYEVVHYPHTENPKREHFQKEVFLGAGGNGKTHLNLEDKGLVRVLYVAPSWKLCSSKKNDHNCDNDVMSNVLHPKKSSDIRKYYNVLVIDECSMINEETKQQLFNWYPQMKIIFCGDLGYQLPPVKGKEMTVTDFDNTTTLTKNYRIQCDKQKKICEKVRKMIKNKVEKNLINQFICESYENIESPENYKPEDIILCSKTRCVKHKKEDCNCDSQNICLEYTKKFGETKWKCVERTHTSNRGDIHIGNKPEEGKWENRHGFTIHSVQGETFKETIFIDGRNLFDSRMGYTAISRARFANQIKIVV